MNFDQALQPYVDEDDLVLEKPNSSPGPDTGNGIHGRCVAEIIRHLRGESKPEHVQRFIKIIRSCQVPGWPGLYHKGPRKTGELISADDYRLLAAASFVLGAPFGFEIAAYGHGHQWTYNNLVPGSTGLWKKDNYRACHRRFVGVVPGYLMSGGLPCGVVGQFEISTALGLGALSSHESSRILDWATVLTVQGRCSDNAVGAWRKGLRLRFADGMRGVMGSYYNKPDLPPHPFATYFPAAYS